MVHLRLVDYTLAEKEMAAAATSSVSATAAAASASLPPHTLPSGGTAITIEGSGFYPELMSISSCYYGPSTFATAVNNKLASASEVTKNKTLHKSRDKNVIFSHSALPSDHS